jgi:6-pyruvoyltetrahydropterin/6-carboxytetrahydropterin synthase
MSRVAVIRKAQFNSAHKLWNEQWSAENNKEVFGLCANEHFHGHNYILEVKVTGDVDPETGYVIDLKIVKDIIKEEVEDRFDHKNLNLDTDQFKYLNPTAENIIIVIYDLIRIRLDSHYELHLRLWETEKNSVEYPVL